MNAEVIICGMYRSKGVCEWGGWERRELRDDHSHEFAAYDLAVPLDVLT